MCSSGPNLYPSLLLVLFVLSPHAAAEVEVLPQTPATIPPVHQARLTGPPPISVSPQMLGVTGLGSQITITAEADLPASTVRVEIRDAEGIVVETTELRAGDDATITLDPPDETQELYAFVPDHYTRSIGFSLPRRSIPGWLTILPPAFAILLALMFRQVIPALLAGIWLGAWIVYGGIFIASLRAVDRYLVQALSDTDHISIVIFSMLLGGMVGVMSRSGGTAGLVDALKPYATNSRRGQLVTWLLGLLVFFDDYANTLVVGNTMRPVTDKLRISREKLAYIVDSTAAPVAAIFLISTWIGYEVGLIGDALKDIGSDVAAYTVFLRAIPYNFYPILALGFGFMVAWSGRDFGSMHKAEVRAAAGRVLSERAVPLADFDSAGLTAVEGKPRRWINAAAPVLVVVVVTFAALWFSGRHALLADGDPLGTAGMYQLFIDSQHGLSVKIGLMNIGSVLGAGNSYHALLYASFSGCLTAIILGLLQRILSLGGALTAMLGGFKSMVMAFVILTLAWSIAQVCADLNTSGFMVSTLSDRLDPRFLPTLIFMLSAATAFATGSSWGTMGILLPLAVPTAFGMVQAAGYDPSAAHGILLGAVASVLAGAIFGDHCSPISDTTVLSSMSSACDHVDHVRTQLPYALLVAVVGVLLGGLPSGFGLSPGISLLISLVVLGTVLRLFGKTSRRKT